MSLKDYLEEQEIKKIDEELNEDAVTIIGTALGYGTAGLVAAFGGTLLALGGVKAIKGLAGLWRRIFKNSKEIFKPEKVIREIKTDAVVTKVKKQVASSRDKFKEDLKYVYIAIGNKDFPQASEKFDELPSTLRNNLDARKSIVAEIVKILQAPPIYIQSPGNNTYQAIKKILDIRTARAAAAATEMALKGVSSIEKADDE